MEKELIKNLKGMEAELSGLEKELGNRGAMPEVCLRSLPQLNNILWGLRKGLTVVAARTSQGKSAFALQMAMDTAKQGHSTIVLSLEMDVQDMLERMFSNEYMVDNFELQSGRYNFDQGYKDKFELFKKQMTELPLLLSCGIGKTFFECNRFLEMLDPMPKVVILDYIQMSKTTSNDRIEIGEYVRQFRQMMVEHNIRGIICSQINRMVEKDNEYKPRLENLKGTGALEEVADVVLLLHWNYFYTCKQESKHVYDIAVAKNRSGRTTKHTVKFIPEYSRFEELEVVEDYVK